MNQDYTHITIILDSSGSMTNIWDDTIGGFNAFLQGQKKTPGKLTLSQIHFSSHVHKGYKELKAKNSVTQVNNWHANGMWTSLSKIDVNEKGMVSVPYAMLNNFDEIESVKELTRETFVPGGGTPLLDSIGIAIDETGESLSKLSENERPAKVLFVIITDGEENASRGYDYADIESKITQQTEKYNWLFSYLGANQDAIKAASRFGISSSNSVNYNATAGSVSNTYDMFSSKVSTMRGMSAAAMCDTMAYTDEDRVKAVDETVIKN